ncbi:MAG: PKD domain-containing protein [Methanomassiliicoccus sp.]|nr:PKD domain-containing protein [Methanomassiliicoccus sp.]
MGKKSAFLWIIPVLAAALLLAVPASFIITSVPAVNEAATPSIPYNADSIFSEGTIFDSFREPLDLPGELRDMALGELNGDGITDVAVANASSIMIYHGLGDGSLSAVSTTLTRGGMDDIRSLAIGDLDGDGKDDLAAAYTNISGENPKVTLFYQNTGFSTALDVGIFPDPQRVVIGHFEGSSYNSLAVACRGDPGEGIDANISLIRWPFTQTYHQVQIGVSQMADIAYLTAGYDGSDGRIDLIAGEPGGDRVLVLTQPSTFSPAWSMRNVEIGGSLTDVQMVNYTGNGPKDLAVINSGEERVEIRANTGSGIPASATAIIDGFGNAVAMSFGHLSGSSRPDLVLVSEDDTCRVYTNEGGTVDAEYDHRFPIEDRPVKMLALDHGSSADGIYVLSNGGAGDAPSLAFYPYVNGTIGNADVNVFREGGKFTALYAGNLSFDAVVAIVDGEDLVTISDIAGEAQATLPAQAGPCGLYIGDLDGDGTDDLAVLNGDAGTVSVFRGSSEIMTKGVPDAIVSLGLTSPRSICGGYIGALGEGVLAVGGSDGVEIVYHPLSTPVLESIGAGTTGNRTAVSMGKISSTSVSGGIAALNEGTGRIEIYLVKGSPSIGDCYPDTPNAWLNMVGRAPTSMTMGDFNGDGRDDVAAGSAQGQVRVFLNSDLGFYGDTPASITSHLPGAVSHVSSADLNDDGLDDISVGYSSISKVGLLLSTGSSFSNNINLSAGGRAAGIFAGDINGDQRDDIAASSSSSGALSIWFQRNLAPSPQAWLSDLTPIEGGNMAFDAGNSSDSMSDRPSLTYLWDFGDGNTSTAVSGHHAYGANGSYDGYLEVTDRAGMKGRAVFHVVAEDAGPVAAVYLSSTTIHEGGLIGFFDDSSSFPDRITAYRWVFGDSSPPVSTRDAEHRYLTKGTYVVTHTVWDEDGDISTTNVTVVVQDLPPVASFSSPKYSFSEGETIHFTDASYAYDGIASWSWDLGDGRILTTRNVTTSYPDPGQYIVALTIVDQEGQASSFNHTITVLGTNPGAGELVAVAGGVSFPMDEPITFRVSAWQHYLPIVRYAWDLDHDPSSGFNETPGISVNQTTWSFRAPGEYQVCVRIYDTNSFTERFLTVAINDVLPTARFVSQTAGGGHVTFDGSSSLDSATDISDLEYRWYYGDGSGWTSWSNISYVQHQYSTDGIYQASLEVRDRWGEVDSVTGNIVVDTSAPSIDLDDAAVQTEAYAGEEVVVRAKVTDVSNIERVLLFYQCGDVNGTLVMSRITGTDTYVATIPALPLTGPLTFHVEAEDAGGHSSLSATMNVKVVERPDSIWMLALAAAATIVASLLLLYFRRTTMVVDEVFMIYRDGNLMAHQTRRLKPGMDDQIMGSMLVAIQDFVRDSFKEDASTGLNRMDFGERKVLVEKGDNIYLAVVLHGKREGRVPHIMREAISHTEERFSETLGEWDGDMDKVRGINAEASRLLRGSVLDLAPREKRRDPEGPGKAS